MKTSLLFSVLFVLLISAITPAQSLAAFYSGSDLAVIMPEWDKMYAKARGVDLEKAYIFGSYILGVYDATESQYSIPHGANKGQIIAVVSKYLKAHPEQRGDPAASLVMKALGEAFPKKSQ
jgi:Rap1a immunity proteins